MTNPALLVIDLQSWFLETGQPEKLAAVETLVARTNELIDFFHKNMLLVVQVQTVHRADGSTWNQWMKEHNTGRLIEGTREAKPYPDVHVHMTDIVVQKTRHSAFIRANLEDILLSRNVDTLVLAGFSTDACVGLTAIEAYERDFKIMLAGDSILGTNHIEGNLMLDYLLNRFGIEPVSNAWIMNNVLNVRESSNS